MLQDPETEINSKVDGLQQRVGEVVVQAFGLFLEEYESQLSAVQEALSGTSDLDLKPIHIKVEPEENTTLLELVDSGNKYMNKVVIVFASLCSEVITLNKEFKTYLDVILYYGETDEINSGGVSHNSFIKLVPVLNDLMGFVKRCNFVLVNILNQLAAYYDLPANKGKNSSGDIHFPDVWEHFGRILVMMATLDEVLTNHTVLKDHWIGYENLVKTIVQQSANVLPGQDYDPNKSKAMWLLKALRELRVYLLKGTILESSLNMTFNKTKEVGGKLTIFIKDSIKYFEHNEGKHLLKPRVWTQTCVMYAFLTHNFGNTDKKMFKGVWENSILCPAVTLCGNVLWLPDQFLKQRMPNLVTKYLEKKQQDAMATARTNFISTAIFNLPKTVSFYAFQVFLWVLNMEKTFKKDLSNFSVVEIKTMILHLCVGVDLATKIHSMSSILINLHGALGRPMNKQAVDGICRMVELIKVVGETFQRHSYIIAHNVGHMLQRLAYEGLAIVCKVKAELIADHKKCEKNVDALATLVVAEKCFSGPATVQRFLILRSTISIAGQNRVINEEMLEDLTIVLRNLRFIPKVFERLEKVTCCDFLYWHRVILPLYFTSLLESKTHINRIKYILEATEDAVRVMKTYMKPSITNLLDEEVKELLNKKVIKPLCEEIETSLRLQAHHHLQGIQRLNVDPLRPPECLEILTLPPMVFVQHFIDLKAKVGNYLERTFYDLTTVALHDWRTYGEMRCLAQYKFKITTVEDTLPCQTLEQGLDCLEIMRNIHLFVAKYQYNLNNQIFIEKSSNNKHLTTINIRHIANSIRTHGSGIMNTTVNFTYQFLRNKLHIFSQFLYDEHIKSRLVKELNYFRDNKAQLDSKYSFERAEKFNKDIRRLGVFEGLTFVDKFRELITEIGNALGYVRLVRSGGLHCCSNATRYIPDLDNIVSLETLSRDEGMSDTCIETAQALDKVITNMKTNVTEGSLYFELLVNVFAGSIRSSKNSHLMNFYIMVPALIVNFCDHIITAKEKMSKKSKAGASFTDDGFVMGVAYLLKVLNLNSAFDSLHWFDSLKDKYEEELANVAKQKQGVPKDDEKLHQTLNLTETRLENYQKEFNLLHYSLSSARVFFQTDDAKKSTTTKSGAKTPVPESTKD